MQAGVPAGQGGMSVSIGLPDAGVTDTCKSLSRETHFVAGGNFNGPGQVGIAGHEAAVDDALDALKDVGARRAMRLPVSAPFHTPLMGPASDVMAEAFDDVAWSSPQFPVVSNVDGAVLTSPEAIRSSLVRQVTAPVLWTQCMSTLRSLGCDHFLECGPGSVLSGLSKRIDKAVPCRSIETQAALEAEI